MINRQLQANVLRTAMPEVKGAARKGIQLRPGMPAEASQGRRSQAES